jgi:hypothetical protein
LNFLGITPIHHGTLSLPEEAKEAVSKPNSLRAERERERKREREKERDSICEIELSWYHPKSSRHSLSSGRSEGGGC